MAGRKKGKIDLYKGRNLTVAGYCRLYGGHPDVVRLKARCGDIPFNKPNGVWVITPEAAAAHQTSDGWKQKEAERRNMAQERRLERKGSINYGNR